MFPNKESNLNLQKCNSFVFMLSLVFILCFAYWSYLFFNTEMAIKFDAKGYEELGRMVYEKGWGEYFKTGPHREPFYPLTISISMHLGDIFSVSYQCIQKFIQIILLLATQWLSLLLLNKLKVRNSLKLFVILYIGLSPALVNSTFSLFSEIATYPFVLAIIYFNVLVWQAIHKGSLGKTIGLSFCVAASFIFTIFNKGVFQYIFTAFLIPYVCLAVYSFLKKNKGVCIRSIVYIIITVLSINAAVISFKTFNKKFNGRFEFTNRAAPLLYGNTFKRTEKISKKIFLAHFASIPGSGVCRRFFTEEECRYCEFHQADSSRGTIEGLLHGVPEDKRTGKIIHLAFKRFRDNPLQYIMLMGIESLRMPFWETSQLGFVDYPAWLRGIFNNLLFKDGIRLCVSLVTFFALYFILIDVIKKRRVLLSVSLPKSEESHVIFFIILMIVVYTSLYSLFSIVARYSLIIAPLYLLSIAYFLENMLVKFKNSEKSNDTGE